MGRVLKPIPQDSRLGSILSCILSGVQYNFDISKSLRIQPPTNTPHLKRLFKAGYVTIEDSPEGEGTKGKRYNKKIYSVNLDKIISDYFMKLQEEVLVKEKFMGIKIVSKTEMTSAFKELRQNRCFRLLIKENLIHSYELEIIKRKTELSLNEMFDKINHYFAVEGLENIISRKINMIVDRETEEEVTKIQKISSSVRVFEENSKFLMKTSHTKQRVLNLLIGNKEMKALYNLEGILKYLLKLDEPRGLSLIKVIESFMDKNNVEDLVKENLVIAKEYESKRRKQHMKMWKESGIERKMNQHIKEMGEEYKKQRGNKRKLQKFETLEEEI